jgi:hypothetical protein
MKEIMTFSNYPSTSQLRRYARQAGAHIEFCEQDDFLLRGGGRYRQFTELAKRFGLDRSMAFIAGPLMNR